MDADETTLRWQALVKRLCLYMFLVPVLAGVMVARDVDTLYIVSMAIGALFLFITFIVWTWARLPHDTVQDDPHHG